MKKSLLSFALVAMMSGTVQAETIAINGTDYQANVLTERDLGPGVHWMRLRLPDYPLNVNILTMDMTNPYNRVETTQAYDKLFSTEKLVNAYNRQMTDEKRPLAAANGNFWCVATQEPYSDLLIGVTYSANMRNGKIITETNGHSDQWDGGPSRTGVIAVDTSKKLWIESLYYTGTATNDKTGALTIQQVNKVVRDNEICLYNSYYGTSKTFMPIEQYKSDTDGKKHWNVLSGVATEVYLNLNDGQKWMSGEPMTCTVQEVKTDAGNGTLGSYDLCLVGCGTNKDALAQLAAGDQVTINYAWSTADGVTPVIENAIAGNAMVMLDGELTGRNDDESYNTQIYSRTAYGCSADGKKLYIVVIDKSSDPVYGTSAGCNTSVMCQIMKHYGCSNLCNVDAGGSAQMMVAGEVINRTTEGTPRAVANGWMLYSIAPQDNVIARLEYDDVTLQAPPYSTFTPKILGYNQYGDLIDEDVQGFTLSCASELGSTEGSNFTAGGTAMTGDLTATLNGVSVTKPITIVDASLSLRIKPLLIDAVREYPVEVTATIDENVYTYDPSHIAWTVEDNGIVTIDENGVLRGQKEGTTTYTGTIGEFTDMTSVTVEIASAPKLYPTDYTEWTCAKASGISNLALAEDGTMTFTYGSPRSGVYTKMSKDITYYSIPDKLWLEFTPTINILSVSVDLRGASSTRANKVDILPTSGDMFAAGETHRVEIPISALGDPADLILYPLSLHYIQFNLQLDAANKGDHSIKISELSAEYSNYDDAGVKGVAVDNEASTTVYPNPVTDGMFTVTSPATISRVTVYTMSGVTVLSKPCGGTTATVDAGTLAAGIYIVAVETENGVENAKLVIK